MIHIRDTAAEIRHSVSVSDKAIYRKELMKEEYVLLTFNTTRVITFRKGDYIELEHGRFALTTITPPTFNTDNGGYEYQLRFDAPATAWGSRILFYDRQGNKEKAWSLTRQPQYFLDIVCSNLQSAFGLAYTFAIGQGVEDAAKTLSFDSRSIFDALTDIAEAWNTEWYVDGAVIYLGRCEFGDAVTFDSSIVTQITRQNADASDYVTRLYAFGSTRNIPSNYRPREEGAVIEGVVERRLMLPAGTDHVDAWEDMRPEDVVEGVVAFDEVYPRRTGTLGGVTTMEYTDQIENEDGTTTPKKWLAYRITDTELVFSEKYILPGEELKIVFQSGLLNGMEFGVLFNPENEPEILGDGSVNPAAQILELIRNEDYGVALPNATLHPAAKDTYVLHGYDISLVSDQMIPAAERELLNVARDYLARKSIDPSVYNCKMRSIRCAGYLDGEHSQAREMDFAVGQRVKLMDPAYFGPEGRASRVYGFEKRLDNRFEATYLVGETASYSRLRAIESQVQEITYKGNTFIGN